MSRYYEATPICGWRAKLRNRRVRLTMLRDGSFVLSFKRLDAGGYVQIEKVRISREATAALGELIATAFEAMNEAKKGAKR